MRHSNKYVKNIFLKHDKEEVWNNFVSFPVFKYATVPNWKISVYPFYPKANDL